MKGDFNMAETRFYAVLPGRIAENELIGRHLACEDFHLLIQSKAEKQINYVSIWCLQVSELENTYYAVSEPRFYTFKHSFISHSGPLRALIKKAIAKTEEGYLIEIHSWW